MLDSLLPTVTSPKNKIQQPHHTLRSFKPRESMMIPMIGAHRRYSFAVPAL